MKSAVVWIVFFIVGFFAGWSNMKQKCESRLAWCESGFGVCREIVGNLIREPGRLGEPEEIFQIQ